VITRLLLINRNFTMSSQSSSDNFTTTNKNPNSAGETELEGQERRAYGCYYIFVICLSG
jgi:hypothetical protein